MKQEIGIEAPVSDIRNLLQGRSIGDAVILPTEPESEMAITSMTALFIADLLSLSEENCSVEVSTEAISIHEGVRRSDAFIHLPSTEGEVKGFVLDRRNDFNNHEITFWGEIDSEFFPKTGLCSQRYSLAKDMESSAFAGTFFGGYMDSSGLENYVPGFSTVHILGDDYLVENIDEPNGSVLHLLTVERFTVALALDRLSEDGKELSCWSMPA